MGPTERVQGPEMDAPPPAFSQSAPQVDWTVTQIKGYFTELWPSFHSNHVWTYIKLHINTYITLRPKVLSSHVKKISAYKKDKNFTVCNISRQNGEPRTQRHSGIKDGSI